METFRIDGTTEREFTIRVDEAGKCTPELLRTLLDIDLQTFSESTFSHFTARAYLSNGRVFLLYADDIIIGTCVCMRCWDQPQVAMILSMGIRPGWRGRGLGQRFVRGILERLRHRGLRAICLLVSQDNRRAIRVYEDTGFVITETLPEDDRTRESYVLMQCQLQTDPPLTALPGGTI